LSRLFYAAQGTFHDSASEEAKPDKIGIERSRNVSACAPFKKIHPSRVAPDAGTFVGDQA
jgi:hypothetical protein